ncbi:hypothetical protein MIMGU_mgv1a020650mg [Erythranthe guttata]|uniref:Uncharacterized protein n=1 Tax=Erythranthe guttata TaxID=4155 RepID=A0A022QG98_ERYGU|nr:hypothetical protein MIMGU_mgv1a020650mg [Erythranthe guttata]
MTTGNEAAAYLDLETGDSSAGVDGGGWGSDPDFSDPFDIAKTKNASHESLKHWRVRFRRHLKKDEEQEKRRRMIRAHAQVIRVISKHIILGTTVAPPSPNGDYEIGLEQLASMNMDHNITTLQQYGGVKGLTEMIKTDVETGIYGDENELSRRKNAFGSNTYPVKKGRSFLRFLWEAWQDLTLIILRIAAVASLALGIKTEGLEEGWYDGGSITFVVLLVIFVTATSDYRQSLQFQNLNEEKQNIKLEMIRGGRRNKVSIYEIVVGDVIPLKIGDQVPADGILISGHSLAIDTSSMTGESKIVHKDHKSPFLMSGCKVAAGAGTMMVTGVGINTEWGLLMTSISEDTGEETPLQVLIGYKVRLNGVATFIGIVGLTVALFVLIILLISVSEIVDGVIHIITAAVTIVVVAVPEGLPLAVTLSLAYSMKKMMADKALVRRLSAYETMGSATTICSDKTGTLTLNQMTVVEAYVGKQKMDPPEDGAQLHATISSLLDEGLAQNTSGSVFLSNCLGGCNGGFGSPTEKAVLQWGVKLGMKFDVVKSESIVLHVSPFNSIKKRGGVAVRGKVTIHLFDACMLMFIVVLLLCR